MEMDGEGNLKSGTVGMIKLRKNGKQVPDLSGHIHRLPCCIKYDGPCVISHYFKPNPTGTQADGLTVEESYFRGRKLLGVTLPLPPSYSGFILGKKSVQKRKAVELSEKDSSNCWEMNAKFENIAYWNHENLPSQDDVFFRSFHWLSVAESLHKPVTVEDLASVSTLEKELMK